MLVLTSEQIGKLVRMEEAIEAVKRAFSMLEQGDIVMPLRMAIRAEKGTLLFMPAYAPALGAAVVKNVNVFPENVRAGLPVTTGQILLIDGETGCARALLDGARVTRLRTGAATGAAFDVLGKKSAARER